MNIIFPNVSQMKTFPGEYNCSNPLNIFFIDDLVNAFILFDKEYFITDNKELADIIFKKNDNLIPESYKIKVDEKIFIEYSTDSGAFYAVQTLKQIFIYDSVPKLEIYDEPKTKIRGFMLDISRNKVASLETIKSLIDLMANLKMNHLELYVEGFSFEYQSFTQYLEKDSYITLDEYFELEKYANDRYALDLIGELGIKLILCQIKMDLGI